MTGKLNTSISLILPVYNEKNLLEQAVESCLTALSDSFDDFEIIIVDDGSTDGNQEILELLSKKSPRIKIIYNIVNLNVGIAVQRGLLAARCDYAVHNAVDLPLAPGDIADLIRGMNGCDLLILERSTYAGYMKWRIVTSLINRLLLKILFPRAVKGMVDLNFTQIYRTAIIPRIIPLAKSPAFTTPEMIIRAKYLNLNVKTALVDYKPRVSGKGAFGKPHDILWSMYDMLRFRLKSWRKK